MALSKQVKRRIARNKKWRRNLLTGIPPEYPVERLRAARICHWARGMKEALAYAKRHGIDLASMSDCKRVIDPKEMAWSKEKHESAIRHRALLTFLRRHKERHGVPFNGTSMCYIYRGKRYWLGATAPAPALSLSFPVPVDGIGTITATVEV